MGFMSHINSVLGDILKGNTPSLFLNWRLIE